MTNGDDRLVEIANGKRVARGTIAYHVRGAHNAPRLERLRVKFNGREVHCDYPDLPQSSGTRLGKDEIFATVEEAVADRIRRIDEQSAEAIMRTKALLK